MSCVCKSKLFSSNAICTCNDYTVIIESTYKKEYTLNNDFGETINEWKCRSFDTIDVEKKDKVIKEI